MVRRVLSGLTFRLAIVGMTDTWEHQRIDDSRYDAEVRSFRNSVSGYSSSQEPANERNRFVYLGD